MKIRIEQLESGGEEEVVIRCGEIDERVKRIQQLLSEELDAGADISFYKLDRDTRQSQEYYFPLDEVLFFETESELVWAHTRDDAYRTKLRLYELEEKLPHYFVRASKSTIVNTLQIYSIKRDLTSTSQLQFSGTHKQVYASRRYYSAVKQKMNERSRIK